LSASAIEEFLMASDGDLTDVKHRAYGLILRYGTAALAQAWQCPKTVIYQIVNERVGSSWLQNAAMVRVRTLGARELANRTGVPGRRILIALASGTVPDELALFVTGHSQSGAGWTYPNTPSNEGLN
jgi:hypothetical protein